MDILFTDISHIECEKARVTTKVEKIEPGEKYSGLFLTVEPNVAKVDLHNTFFSDSLYDHYKAKDVRWMYKDTCGSVEFIEEENPSIKYIDGKWYVLPFINIKFLNGELKKLIFPDDETMEKYINENFKEYRSLNGKKVGKNIEEMESPDGTFRNIV